MENITHEKRYQKGEVGAMIAPPDTEADTPADDSMDIPDIPEVAADSDEADAVPDEPEEPVLDEPVTVPPIEDTPDMTDEVEDDKEI